jgi:hypothetical protein
MKVSTGYGTVFIGQENDQDYETVFPAHGTLFTGHEKYFMVTSR